jgi:hypothetical protein
MRRDEMNRKTRPTTMKLEEPTNNNTNSIFIPDESRPTMKTTTIHSKKRKMTHSDDTVYDSKDEKAFQFYSNTNSNLPT